MEPVAVVALWSISRGASRTGKLVYHGDPMADVACAAILQLAKELWRARARDTAAVPLHGGIANLRDAWAVLLGYQGGWRDAEGPLHVAALELNRAGFVPQAGYTISCGRVVLNLLRHSPALVRYHLNRAHQAERAKALADRGLWVLYACGAGDGRAPGEKLPPFGRFRGCLIHWGFVDGIAYDRGGVPGGGTMRFV